MQRSHDCVGLQANPQIFVLANSVAYVFRYIHIATSYAIAIFEQLGQLV